MNARFFNLVFMTATYLSSVFSTDGLSATLYDSIGAGFDQGLAPSLVGLNSVFYSGRCVRADSLNKVVGGGLWLSYDNSSAGPIEEGVSKFGVFEDSSAPDYFDNQPRHEFERGMQFYLPSTSPAIVASGSQICTLQGMEYQLRQYGQFYYFKGFSGHREFIRCYFFQQITHYNL